MEEIPWVAAVGWGNVPITGVRFDVRLRCRTCGRRSSHWRGLAGLIEEQLDLCCAEVQLDVSTKTQGVFFFEHFRLDPVSGTLARNGVPIKLPARLFDTLCCLVRNGGDLVERGRLERLPARRYRDITNGSGPNDRASRSSCAG
jgi:DNA-binding response OmpR family regulator